MDFLRTVCWAVLIHIAMVGHVAAQDVTLTSRDGSVEIVGTLLGYDGEFYRVDSTYGELTLDGSGVICAGPGCPDLEAFVANISFTGAQSIGNRLLPRLIETFAREQEYNVSQSEPETGLHVYSLTESSSGHMAARFNIRLSSSDEGFADLLAEEADIAMSLREVLPDEIALGVGAGLGRLSSPGQNRVVALDALVPVVSPRNRVQQISPEDLARIYAGDISNWQDLGGIDAPITLHLPKAGSGVLHVFLERIMYPSERNVMRQVIRHSSSTDLVQAVAADPFAIGLTTLSEPGKAKPLVLAGGCGFRAGAVPEALKSDDYPLTAPVFFYLPARRLPAVARDFLRFSQSPAAQVAILRAGFVDQAISRTPISRQGDRLANAIRNAGDEITLVDLQRLVQAMDGARRLSVTFRFDGGSSRLNAQSRSNITLLARALETGMIGTSQLTFVGFSDAEGSADANQRLSRQRAASVRDAVVTEAATADPNQLSIRVAGFGEALPMACDDSEWGRQINRRVEVWVR